MSKAKAKTREQRIDTEREECLPRVAYSIGEVAAMLGVSTKSVRRLIARGLIRASKALRHRLIPASEIHRFLDQTMK